MAGLPPASEKAELIRASLESRADAELNWRQFRRYFWDRVRTWESVVDALATALEQEPEDEELAKLMDGARRTLMKWEVGAQCLSGPIKLEEWKELVGKTKSAEGSR